MSARRSRLVPVLLAAVLLVGAANLGAFAATGGPLLLGKGNTASKTTKLKTTGNGAALSLKSKGGRAPLKVSNSTKVTKLNADLVDGLDSTGLQTKSYVYELTAIGLNAVYVTFALPGLPSGRYHASFSVSANIGGSPALFACFLLTGTEPNVVVPVAAAGIDAGSGNWFVSGSGYLDTTTATYRLACQRAGGTTVTIPNDSRYPARLVLTRVDDVTATNSTGVGGVEPRP
ncbi:hypothetical protein [Nocardioides dilutus]